MNAREESEKVCERRERERRFFPHPTMSATLTAALQPLQASDRPTRYRPQRQEREKRRAAQAKKVAKESEPSTATQDDVDVVAENYSDWLPLADTQAAPCPVVFSLDSA